MNDCLSYISTLGKQKITCVLVVLIQVKGSTPREVGAKMVVTENDCFGSIGGGSLEYETINHAQELLCNGAAQGSKHQMRTYILGADVGQCCGGVCTVYLETLPPVEYSWLDCLLGNRNNEPCVLVTPLDTDASASNKLVFKNDSKVQLTTDLALIEHPIRVLLNSSHKPRNNLQLVYRNSEDSTPSYMLELYDPNNFRLIIFGAGHVGKAVIHVMSELPCHITWVDPRSEMFPSKLAHNVEKIISEQYEQIIAKAHANTFFLVMTHSHPLDLKLCELILKREDFAYLGLIGSKIKRIRFEKRLLEQDCQPEILKRLVCPIGISSVFGKQPRVIAVAVTAQILQHWNEMVSNSTL